MLQLHPGGTHSSKVMASYDTSSARPESQSPLCYLVKVLPEACPSIRTLIILHRRCDDGLEWHQIYKGEINRPHEAQRTLSQPPNRP